MPVAKGVRQPAGHHLRVRWNKPALAREGLQLARKAVRASVKLLIEFVQFLQQFGCGCRHYAAASSRISGNLDFGKNDPPSAAEEINFARFIETHEAAFDEFIVRARTIEEELMKAAIVDLILEEGQGVIKLLGLGKSAEPSIRIANPIN